MIPAWMLKRDGEVDFFCRINGQMEATPSLEIYSTNNGDAIGINYKHHFFDDLEIKLKTKLISDSGFDEDAKKAYSLYLKWENLAQWRRYKDNIGGGNWSCRPSVWYCSEVEERDIEQLRELHDPWSGHGFSLDSLDGLRKYAEQYEDNTDKILFEKYKELTSKVLKSNACVNDRNIGKRFLALVSNLVDVIEQDKNGIVSRSLKIPIKDIKNNPGIKQTFDVIQKLKNLTAQNLELLDTYSKLEELVSNVPRYGYKQPIRELKYNLETMLKYYVS